jgi:hypothetical protein
MSNIMTKTGEILDVGALARKIKASIIEAGGTIQNDEDTILTALGAYDEGAHVTDGMNDDTLSDLLNEFEEAWKSET